MNARRQVEAPVGKEPTFLYADERRAKGKAQRDEALRDEAQRDHRTFVKAIRQGRLAAERLE